MHPIQSRLKRIAATGSVLILGAAFNFAVLDILVKILGPSFRVWDIAFYRFSVSLFILTAILGWRQISLRGYNPRLMALNGLISSMGFVALATSIRHITISTAMVLFYSFPAFAAIFSTFFFKERIRKGELACVAVALMGVMVLVEFRLGGSLLGQLMGLTAGLCIGLSVAMVRKLRERDGAMVIYLYYCLVGTAVAFPPFMSHPQIPVSAVEIIIVAGIIVSSLFAMLLMNKGLRYCKSWEGGLILTNELLFTAIFGIVFLGDAMSLRLIIGGGLILASVVALNLGTMKRPTSPPIVTADR